MLKSIENKEKKIKCFHEKVKELNKLDNPSFFNKVFQQKKIDEPEEVAEAVEVLKKAIFNLHSEIADEIITNRDSLSFDYRLACARLLSKHGIFDLVRLLRCDEEILNHCHLKVDRTINRIKEGYYEK